MTETNEIKTASINALTIGKDGSRDVLLIGLKPPYQDKPQYQRTLKREFAACHEIDHPHIIKYVDEKVVDGYGPCIEMEWEPARSLPEYLQEGHGVEEKKEVMRQIAEALSFIHGAGQVHGALTPATIFVTTQGDRVKVLHFRLRYADGLYEPASSLKFRAPEAKDGTVTLDARADVFSLGAILKEMDLGDDYENVVTGSCSFGRNDRYADVATFLEAFEHRRISRRSKSAGESCGVGSSKKSAFLLVTIVTLLVVAALVFFNRQSDGGEMEPAQAEMVDSTRQTPAPSEVESAQAEDGQTVASERPAANQSGGMYTGELEFMNKLVPQMHIDLDKIYAKGGDAGDVRKRVTAYYKGLRKALGKLNDNQFAAYDKAFAEYIQQKNGEAR